MKKQIIEKIITDILKDKEVELKCSRTTLDKADREAIELFEKTRDKYPKNWDERMELYKKHRDIQAKHNYTKAQKDAISEWGHSGFLKINGRIYDTKDYKEGIEEGTIDEDKVIQDTKNLQSAIDDGVRVPHDTVTLREGHWNPGHKEGDVIVQEGFASTAYSDSLGVSESLEDEYDYDITYYVPTGTKGVLLDDSQFSCLDEEELLLGRGTRQYVLNQDDDEKTVEVLILPDR